MWYLKILEGNRDKVSKTIHAGTDKIIAIADLYRGIGVNNHHVKSALAIAGVEDKNLDDIGFQESKKFAAVLRKISKPTLIVANKIDVEGADKNFARLRERYNDTIVVPASADSELSLRRAEQKGQIKYSPGSEQFDIEKTDDLSQKQKGALDFITKEIMGEYMRTGVRFAINVTVFKLLKMNARRDGGMVPSSSALSLAPSSRAGSRNRRPVAVDSPVDRGTTSRRGPLMREKTP